jgi:hypothetical protein
LKELGTELFSHSGGSIFCPLTITDTMLVPALAGITRYGFVPSSRIARYCVNQVFLNNLLFRCALFTFA